MCAGGLPVRLGGTTKTVGLGFALFGVLWIWCCVAADYGYKAVSGTYTFDRGQERSTLILDRNQSFEQELRTAGHIEHTRGSWRRTGEGGVVFSKDFLTVVGQQRGAGGQVHGQVRKGFGGLFVSIIVFEPEPERPSFYKR